MASRCTRAPARPASRRSRRAARSAARPSEGEGLLRRAGPLAVRQPEQPAAIGRTEVAHALRWGRRQPAQPRCRLTPLPLAAASSFALPTGATCNTATWTWACATRSRGQVRALQGMLPGPWAACHPPKLPGNSPAHIPGMNACHPWLMGCPSTQPTQPNSMPCLPGNGLQAAWARAPSSSSSWPSWWCCAAWGEPAGGAACSLTMCPTAGIPCADGPSPAAAPTPHCCLPPNPPMPSLPPLSRSYVAYQFRLRSIMQQEVRAIMAQYMVSGWTALLFVACCSRKRDSWWAPWRGTW